MSTIQAATAANAAPAASESSSPAAPTSAVEIEHRFLTLLVTQMKNQDPLNPLDNAQLTTQLAQISTVSGIDRLNATMTSIAATLATKPPATDPTKQTTPTQGAKA